MDLKEIKNLVKLVETSDIEELEIQEEGFQVRITKAKAKQDTIFTGSDGKILQTLPIQVPSVQPEAPVHEAKIEPLPDGNSKNVVEICSPMVGTFYRSPAPDADSYVQIGDEVHPGKILCIIEAMKLMNEIEAEVSGKIVKILTENAQPVEYNQPLFLVEKV